MTLQSKNLAAEQHPSMPDSPLQSQTPPFPIRACLFDMDGLLINSEDLITHCINDILARYGHAPLPWDLKVNLQGRSLAEASKILLDWAEIPLTPEEYQRKLQKLHEKWFPTAALLPGVPMLLWNLQRATTATGDEAIELALVTSSNTAKFALKTDHLTDLLAVFPPQRRVLGDDPRISSGRHKPAPDAYQICLAALNAERRAAGRAPIPPAECLVLEDSVQGVEAGRRAGMQVLWCPHTAVQQELRGREDVVLTGPLPEDPTDAAIDVMGASSSAYGPQAQTQTWAGANQYLGWTRMVRSLEKFDYGQYGITLPTTTNVMT